MDSTWVKSVANQLNALYTGVDLDAYFHYYFLLPLYAHHRLESDDPLTIIPKVEYHVSRSRYLSTTLALFYCKTKKHFNFTDLILSVSLQAPHVHKDRSKEHVEPGTEEV